jgi:hypothetical protein
LFSYLSKLNKEIQANQGHQRGASTHIFQIRFFLVYLRLLKGDKSDSNKKLISVEDYYMILKLHGERRYNAKKNERRRRVAVVIIQKHVRKWLVRRAYLKFHTVLLEKGVSNKGIPKA